MYSRVRSSVLKGINAVPVVVETDISRGLPSFNITGLADTSIREAALRIRAAVINSGFQFPKGRITLNIAPADIRKKGTGLDLAIAIGLLTASGQLEESAVRDLFFMGELSLEGEISSAQGILSISEMARSCGAGIVVPEENVSEALLIADARVYTAGDLRSLVDDLTFGDLERRESELDITELKRKEVPDFADVRGQEFAKRALVISAAGGHCVLMTGSPGTGKSMLASRLPGILPGMSYGEILETTKIYSASGHFSGDVPLILERPYRDPHHKISVAGLLGGGMNPYPGEISLATNGVLFLDELAEFDQNVIDTLREPMETKEIRLIRGGECTVFPAKFLLIAATNPCKCGYYGDPQHECTCTQGEIDRYRARISGPILDRIDIHIRLQPVSYSDMSTGSSMSTAEMRELVLKAREMQKERFGKASILNTDMKDKDIMDRARLDQEGRELLGQAFSRLKLNPRVMMKTIKIARTIGDIDGDLDIGAEAVSEALQYSRFTDGGEL